jgi:hypothetical protein
VAVERGGNKYGSVRTIRGVVDGAISPDRKQVSKEVERRQIRSMIRRCSRVDEQYDLLLCDSPWRRRGVLQNALGLGGRYATPRGTVGRWLRS